MTATVTASDASATYGDASATFTVPAGYTVTGLVNGDSIGSLSCSTGYSQFEGAGTYPGATSCSGTTNANYDVTFDTGTLTIGAKGATVTASDASATYGDASATFTVPAGYTVTGLVNGDSIGSLSCSTGYSQFEGAGTYPGATSCSGTTNANYDVTFDTGTLTIGAKGATVTASDASATYGDASATFTVPAGYTVTGLVNGDSIGSLSCSTGYSQFEGAGTYPGATSCSGTTNANYDVTFDTGTLTIGAKGATVTASDASATYGDASATFTVPAGYTVTGLVNGDSIGSLSCSTGYSQFEGAGTYPGATSCSGTTNANYDVTFDTGTLTIGAKGATVTASDASATYGDASATFTVPAGYTVTGLVNGDSIGSLSCSTGYSQFEGAGTYPGATSCSGTTNANYDVTFDTGTLTIGAKGATVTASDASATYGDASATFTVPAGYTVTGLVNGDSIGSLSCSTGYSQFEGAGTYPGATSCSGTTNANYDVTFDTGTLTIGAKGATVTASDASATYGDASATFTVPAGYTVTGLVNGDSIGSLSCSTGYSQFEGAGTYPGATSCSGTTNANYDVTFDTGTLTIGAKGATVTASDASATYGDASATFTVPAGYTVTGLVNGDSIGSLSCSTGYSQFEGAGTYPGATSCSGTTNANYDVTFDTGTLTIGAKGATVTASDASATYGDASATFTVPAGYTVTGLVNGDSIGSLSCSTGYSQFEGAGTYPGATSCSGTTNANYDVTFDTGTLTIGAKGATVTASDASATYGDASATFTVPAGYTVTGLVNGDSIGSLSCSTGYSQFEGAGTYPGATSCSGTTNANYDVTFDTGTLTIGAKGATVTASDASATYGDASATFTVPAGYTVTGLVNGDSIGSLSCSTGYSQFEGAGTYPGATSCSGTTNANYDVTFDTGTLTIGAKGATVTASDASATYGDASATFTVPAGYTVTGLVNGDSIGSLSCSTGYSQFEGAGTYPGATSCSGTTNANYDVTFDTGTLTIGAKGATVTASDASATYGDASATFTVPAGYTVTGLVNGDSIGSLSCSTGYSQFEGAGTYPGATSCSGTTNANYDVTFDTGTLTIGAKGATVTASDASATYGDASATFTVPAGYTVTGLVNGDSIGSLSCSTGYSQFEGAGTYPGATSCSGTTNANYDVTFDTGTLTIGAKGATVTASDASATYGDASATFTVPAGYTVTGLVNGDSIGSLSCSTGYSQFEGAGTYPGATSCSGAVNSNYSISYVSGTLTVLLSGQTINAPAPSSGPWNMTLSVYATATSGLTVTYNVTGGGAPGCFVDGLGNVSASGSGTCIVTLSQGGDDSNYLAAPSVDVTVTFEALSQTITAPTNPSGFYTGSLSVFATATSGLTVTYTVAGSTAPGCGVTTGGFVTATGPGTCVINLDQAGDADWSAAPTVSVVVTFTSPTVTVTFDPGSGSGSMPSETFTIGDGQALTTNGFSNPGYTFAGWATSSGGSVVYSNQQTITVSGSETLYAVWTPITYTVTFSSSAGTGSTPSETFTYGVSQASSPSPPLSPLSLTLPHTPPISPHHHHQPLTATTQSPSHTPS